MIKVFFLSTIYLLYLGFNNPSFADTSKVILTDHPQLALLVRSVVGQQKNLEIRSEFQFKEDPHHFSPKMENLKNLVKEQYLVLAYKELSPWASQVLKKRSKQAKTLILPSKHFESEFPLHAQAHFWLFPKIGCKAFQYLRTELSKWKIPLLGKKQCPYILNDRFELCLKKLSKTWIILTHDALIPILKRSGAENLLTLKTSHHGAGISPENLKKIHQLKEEKPNAAKIWIFETQISGHENLRRLVSSHDKIIPINSLGFDDQSSGQTLDSFERALVKTCQQLNLK